MCKILLGHSMQKGHIEFGFDQVGIEVSEDKAVKAAVIKVRFLFSNF